MRPPHPSNEAQDLVQHVLLAPPVGVVARGEVLLLDHVGQDVLAASQLLLLLVVGVTRSASTATDHLLTAPPACSISLAFTPRSSAHHVPHDTAQARVGAGEAAVRLERQAAHGGREGVQEGLSSWMAAGGSEYVSVAQQVRGVGEPRQVDAQHE